MKSANLLPFMAAVALLASGAVVHAQKTPPAKPELLQSDIERTRSDAPKLFIEIARPEPAYVAREKAERESMLSAGYDEDLNARRRDATYAPPSRLELTGAELSADPDQSRTTGPFLEIQVRRRELVRHTKTWMVERDRLFSGRVREKETIPIYSEWSWEPEMAVGNGETCVVTVVRLRQQRGALAVFNGVTDADGRLRLPLLYFMKAFQGGTPSGEVEIRFELPEKGVRLSCILPEALVAKIAADFQLARARSGAYPPTEAQQAGAGTADGRRLAGLELGNPSGL